MIDHQYFSVSVIHFTPLEGTLEVVAADYIKQSKGRRYRVDMFLETVGVEQFWGRSYI